MHSSFARKYYSNLKVTQNRCIKPYYQTHLTLFSLSEYSQTLQSSMKVKCSHLSWSQLFNHNTIMRLTVYNWLFDSTAHSLSYDFALWTRDFKASESGVSFALRLIWVGLIKWVCFEVRMVIQIFVYSWAYGHDIIQRALKLMDREKKRLRHQGIQYFCETHRLWTSIRRLHKCLSARQERATSRSEGLTRWCFHSAIRAVIKVISKSKIMRIHLKMTLSAN